MVLIKNTLALLDLKIEIIETIGKIVVFIMALLAVFLFTVKTKNKLANTLFGWYLLVIAFDLIGLFTNKAQDYPNIQNLKMASSLLQMPLFYLYVLSACYHNFKIRGTHVLHGLLFLLFLFIFKTTDFSDHSLLLYEILGELQFVLYIVALFIVLKKYKTVYLENYSNANYALHTWLFQITLFSCIAHSFVLFRWYLSHSIFQEYVLNINILISLSVLAITMFFVLKALYQPALFTGINMQLKSVKMMLQNNSGTIVKRETSENKNVQKLIALMEHEKPYLDFELTLQKLAIQANIPERELSLLINHHLNKHFFDFINEYRIQDAKLLLTDPEKKEVTVLEILYQIGFNSKSSFYTAFKKATNMTPSAYRKSVRSA